MPPTVPHRPRPAIRRAIITIPFVTALLIAARLNSGPIRSGADATHPGFALQDASGGIYVARALDQAIELGSRVRVWGTLAAPDQRITVEPTTLQITGQGSAPAPLEVATGGVGPATEGRLIAVRGRVAGAIVDDRPWGSKLYVNDGSGPLLVFIAAATSIDGTRYRAGQELRIVGFSGRFGDHTEVLPRGPSDIEAGPM